MSKNPKQGAAQAHLDGHPTIAATEAFRAACAEGRLVEAKSLLSSADPRSGSSMALRLAARNGHDQVVALLIPLCDPTAKDSAAYHEALSQGHGLVIDMLRQHSVLRPVKLSFIA